MTRLRHLAHLATVLAGLCVTMLAVSVSAPAAFAQVLPPDPGPANPAPAGGLAVAVGMPGWQITLIAAGAALTAAVLAVLLYRTWAMRRTIASA